MTKTTLFAKYQSGGQFNVVDQSLTTGNVWWVDSGSAQALNQAGSGYNPDYPFATVNFAITQCVANNGDVIFAMPGHIEYLGPLAAVLCNVAGIKIIGLGHGFDRPTFINIAAADTVLINCTTWIENISFLTGIDASIALITVNAVDCVIKDCVFEDAISEATDWILTTPNASRLLVDGCNFYGASTAGTNSAIAIAGGADIEIKGCYFKGDYAVGAIDVRTAPTSRLWVHDCKIWTIDAADIAVIDTITTSTGNIGPNLQIMLQDHAANITEACTGATFRYFDNIYVCNLVSEKGMLINKIASA